MMLLYVNQEERGNGKDNENRKSREIEETFGKYLVTVSIAIFGIIRWII